MLSQRTLRVQEVLRSLSDVGVQMSIMNVMNISKASWIYHILCCSEMHLKML
jgi:hypothetical protein